MVIQLIAWVVMAYLGFKGSSIYSPVLFVEGMILANIAIMNMSKGRSISHL